MGVLSEGRFLSRLPCRRRLDAPNAATASRREWQRGPFGGLVRGKGRVTTVNRVALCTGLKSGTGARSRTFRQDFLPLAAVPTAGDLLGRSGMGPGSLRRFGFGKIEWARGGRPGIENDLGVRQDASGLSSPGGASCERVPQFLPAGLRQIAKIQHHLFVLCGQIPRLPRVGPQIEETQSDPLP